MSNFPGSNHHFFEVDFIHILNLQWNSLFLLYIYLSFNKYIRSCNPPLHSRYRIVLSQQPPPPQFFLIAVLFSSPSPPLRQSHVSSVPNDFGGFWMSFKWCGSFGFSFFRLTKWISDSSRLLLVLLVCGFVLLHCTPVHKCTTVCSFIHSLQGSRIVSILGRVMNKVTKGTSKDRKTVGSASQRKNRMCTREVLGKHRFPFCLSKKLRGRFPGLCGGVCLTL